MIDWRTFLAMLAEDGVTLDRVEQDAMEDDGGVAAVWFLSRHHQGQVLHYVLDGPVVPDDPVTRFVRRRIANSLRLSPEKYVFPDF